ncbi:phospholipid carrier-dependent glycosyltransferase [Kaarinaea lacus]
MTENSSAPAIASSTAQVHDRSARWFAAGVIAFFVLLYILPLGVRPLTIPDESRYAEIPREILSTGDWVVPRYNGLRYFEKPPMGYWLNAVSLAVFGENAFAARLPGALSAGFTALLIFLFASRSLGSRQIALYATLVYISFLAVYAVGTISVLDNFLALFLTGGILAFYLAEQATQKKQALLLWIASGISLGLAFLAKGFLALAIPVIVMAPWMLWQGKWRALFSYGWLVVLVALLVALPWALLVHNRESDFWHYFFWVEHVQRFSAEDAQHKAPFYYYLTILPAVAFPWFTLIPAAFSGLKDRVRQVNDTPLFRFLWIWLLAPFLFFSVSSGKLATYILPCFPPLAILIAVGLHRYLQRPYQRLFNAGVLINLGIMALVFVALAVVQNFGVGRAAYAEDELISYVMVMLSLIAVLVVGLLRFKSKQAEIYIASIALCILPLMFIGHLGFPEQVLKRKSPELLIQQHVEQIPADAIVIADSYVIGAVAWTLKRQDIYLTSPGEFSYGLEYPDAAHRLLNFASFTELLQQNRKVRKIVMICSEGCDKRLLKETPPDVEKYSYGIFDLLIFPKQNDDAQPATH